MRLFTSRRFVIATTLLVAVSTVAAAQHLFADVTGKWKFATVMADRTSESLVTLKQSGDTLSGTIEIEQMGSREITGTVKGDTIKFGFSIDMQGNLLQINGSGVVKDKDTINGELAIPNGMGNFQFSAKRQP